MRNVHIMLNIPYNMYAVSYINMINQTVSLRLPSFYISLKGMKYKKTYSSSVKIRLYTV